MTQIPPLTVLRNGDGSPIFNSKCSLNCNILNTTFGGGLCCGQITELVGESGSGKTQFCYQLMLTAQLQKDYGGLSGSSVYLHTDGNLSTKRLNFLADAMVTRGQLSPANSPLDYIYCQKITTPEELMDAVRDIQPLIQSKLDSLRPIRVIVIDSVASVFRGSFENTPKAMSERRSIFFVLSQTLRSYAHKFKLIILTTNQVSDIINNNAALRIGNDPQLITSGRQVCPALGLSWSSCVNARFFLSINLGPNGQRVQKRTLQVVYAPNVGKNTCSFFITNDCIVGFHSINV